jgi:hypothetical protein|tara:strand:- start:4517 stop:5308 length:792 start_codon:yes stop_codon:yes gene_type:complete
MYLRRFTTGLPKPWTSDPILRDYKFTNVFRQLDTGTLWLTENFLKPKKDYALDLILFNICWYRMFNWIGTGARLGWRKSWPAEEIIDVLTEAFDKGEQIFTGAHIIHSEPGEPKIDSIVDVCLNIFNDRQRLTKIARRSLSLEETFKALKVHRHVGSFLAYEMVSDMRWTRLLEHAHDINTWANPGPGAMRGLYRIGLPSTEKTGVGSMRLLLAEQDKHRETWVPVLEMRDIEHSLCEFDKYARVKFGEGKPRGRYNGRGNEK